MKQFDTFYMSQESNSYQIFVPLMLSLMVIIGMLIGRKMDDGPKTPLFSKRDKPVVIEQPGKVEEILKYIDAQYVDSIDRNHLTRTAIKAILKELDPHSYYIDALEYKEINEKMKGSFEGIGIEYILFQDTLIVADVIADAPSKKAGLEIKDRIIEVGDSTIAGQNLSQDHIKDLIKGAEGSTVRLTIHRPGVDSLMHFEVIRDKIPIKSVPVAYHMTEDISYVEIRRFSRNSYDEFLKALEQLKENGGLKHLIIDLRGNPGGYLKEAVKVLSQLFENSGKLLVYTKGLHVPLNEYRSTGRNFYDIERVALLIDEHSASASEIMAGALQDWDRGVVIGRRSYGKGLVQQQYDLRDGSALRLTVARYYTPIGRSLQREYLDQEQYDQAFEERYDTGELFNKDSVPRLDSTQRWETFDGRPVFGGEGIVPDIFIPLDSMYLDTTYLKARNLIMPYLLTDLNWIDYKERYTSGREYMDRFTPGTIIMSDFKAFAEKQGLDFNQWSTERRDKISHLIKATLAGLLYDDLVEARIIHQRDESVLTAVQAIQSEYPLTYGDARE